MQRIIIALLLFWLVAVLVPTTAATQVTLLGTLVDADDRPVPGMDVTVRGADFEETATTDKKGHFKVIVPDAGVEYEIRFEREGLPGFSEALVLDPRGRSQRKTWRLNLTPPKATTENMAALEAYNNGVVAFNEGDPDTALQKFDEAITLDPQFVNPHLQIARIHASRANHERAAAAAVRLLALESDHVDALQILYDAEHALGRDSAAETLDRLAAVAPGRDTAVLAYNEGLNARRIDDVKRARERYTLATQLDPTLVQAHTALAGVLLEAKEYEAALASSERALEIDSEDVRGVSHRYNTLIALGRHDEAEAMIDELQRLAPDAVAQAYLERGTLLFEEGQIDGAIEALERVLAADPRAPRAHYLVGLCYMNRERNADARKHLRTFLELAPDDANAGSARGLLEVLGSTE